MLIFSFSFLILFILCMKKLLYELINIKQLEKSLSYKLSKEKLKNVIGETIEFKGCFTQTMCFGGLSFYIFLFLFVLTSVQQRQAEIALNFNIRNLISRPDLIIYYLCDLEKFFICKMRANFDSLFL